MTWPQIPRYSRDGAHLQMVGEKSVGVYRTIFRSTCTINFCAQWICYCQEFVRRKIRNTVNSVRCMKSEKLQFDRSLATDSEATYRLPTKSHLCLDAGIGGTFYSIPVDSYRNFRRILLYAAIGGMACLYWVPLVLRSLAMGTYGLSYGEVWQILI